MIIRKAIMNDYNNIEQIYKDVILDLKKHGIEMWTGDYPLNILKEDIENNGESVEGLYVLEDETNAIVGCFAILTEDLQYKDVTWTTKIPTLYIERIVINPIYQGKGLSNNIMRWFLEKAEEIDCSSARLTVLETNPKALSLYKKFGFEECDRGGHMTKSGRIAVAFEIAFKK